VGIGDDIVPLTHLEFMITTLCTVIGLIMYSLIIGSATGALEMRDARRLERQQVHAYHGISTIPPHCALRMIHMVTAMKH
jgi:hypothetical protein